MAAHPDLIQCSPWPGWTQAQLSTPCDLIKSDRSHRCQGLCRPSLISVAVYDNSVPHIFMLNICIKNWIPTPGSSTSFLLSDHIPNLNPVSLYDVQLKPPNSAHEVTARILGGAGIVSLDDQCPALSWPRQGIRRYLWDFLPDFKLGWLLWRDAKSVSPRCRIFINMTFAAVFISKT